MSCQHKIVIKKDTSTSTPPLIFLKLIYQFKQNKKIKKKTKQKQKQNQKPKLGVNASNFFQKLINQIQQIKKENNIIKIQYINLDLGTNPDLNIRITHPNFLGFSYSFLSTKHKNTNPAIDLSCQPNTKK